MNMKASLINSFVAVFGVYVVLCDVFVCHTVAQDIRFGDPRNVDRILLDNFGSGLNTRISRPPAASCTMPDQQQGRCVSMSQCQIFIPLVQRIQEPGIFTFIRERICSLEVTTVRICCPNDPNRVALPPSSPRLPSSPQSSGGFVQTESPFPTTQPVRINFGGPSSGGSSQAIPVPPPQNRPFPNFPSQPSENFSIPPTNTAGSFFPTTQTQNPFAQGTVDQIPVSLPVRPPVIPSQTPSSQNPLALGTTQAPQNGVIFSPNAIIPDRMDEDQSQDSFSDSTTIPFERECGSLDRLRTSRANGQSHWPWLVAMGFFDETGNFEVTCGGAVITPKHVITAAHCVTVRARNPTHVRLGDYVAKPQDIRIADVQTSNYKSDTFANDIAIITLAQDVAFDDFIQPLCLPQRFRYDGFRYQDFRVIGWTHTHFIKGRIDQPQEPSDFLAPVLGLQECQKKYQKTSKNVIIDRRNLCIVGGNQNVCLRDSSAIALYHDDVSTNRIYLAGLGSFGFGCDQPEAPYVFTRIGHHLPWILNVIEGKF
ncbi:phenoloxidase-activating enzyme 1-like [Palaemon carinicauda]|uniref:phenoloxidase-activating enzyme 1-like n=1 Tax=Palaemon carinicauda TaxID=392227 RepID=UPI0035B5EFA6